MSWTVGQLDFSIQIVAATRKIQLIYETCDAFYIDRYASYTIAKQAILNFYHRFQVQRDIIDPQSSSEFVQALILRKDISQTKHSWQLQHADKHKNNLE